jgi:hypothetical protein
MIFTIVFIAIAVLWVLLMTIQKYGGELFINPVIGFMVGVLHVEEEGEHTFQILLGLVSLTFVWYNE